MSWNPVMNKFIEIKNEFHKRMGYITYNMDEKKTCLELWVECLNSIEPINQYSDYGFNLVSTLIAKNECDIDVMYLFFTKVCE